MSRRSSRTTTPTSVFVRNVHHDVRAEDIRKKFDKYGDISDVYIPLDYHTRESRGFAYIQFDYEEDALDAVDELDGSTLFGRQIFCKNARGGRKTPHMMRYKGSGDRKHSHSRSRSRSRSPRRRRSHSRSRSRSPVRKSHRSRSPQNNRSRSPQNNRSRSPRNNRSRSPQNNHSRSQQNNRSRSRSPQFKRSPVRENNRRSKSCSRSNSPAR